MEIKNEIAPERKNINMLKDALIRDGYNKKGNWYKDSELAVKINKKSIILKTQKGTVNCYVDPNTLTFEMFAKVMQTAML